VLVPASDDATWDVIRGGFGPDGAALDQALAYVFEHFSADAGRLAIAGFSDGASYALSIGLTNGDLFPRIFAFSPGFVVPGLRSGRPFVFISHGSADRVLPIDRCSRQIVPILRSEGYEVQYREFSGGHEVPPAIVTAALDTLPG
jgi:phospholipase/carboxylesterase